MMHPQFFRAISTSVIFILINVLSRFRFFLSLMLQTKTNLVQDIILSLFYLNSNSKPIRCLGLWIIRLRLNQKWSIHTSWSKYPIAIINGIWWRLLLLLFCSAFNDLYNTHTFCVRIMNTYIREFYSRKHMCRVGGQIKVLGHHIYLWLERYWCSSQSAP